ncbi:MAG: sel1 repeat family protein [Verrucomicrobiales bacterium]|nr:sel1 repeat family protein [Verrucomicrobiales bacterium]
MTFPGYRFRPTHLAVLSLSLALGWFGGGCGHDDGEMPVYSTTEIAEIEQKAKAGDADAAHLRGVLEHQGLGLPPNALHAAEWYRRADQLGHPTAGTELGLLYLNGDGVPKDATEASHWFRRAANHGRADAQFYLARLYQQGQGVARDEVQALTWYRLASQGEPHVKEAPVEARELAQRLTPEQIAEADRQAKAFQTRPVEPTASKPE